MIYLSTYFFIIVSNNHITSPNIYAYSVAVTNQGIANDLMNTWFKAGLNAQEATVPSMRLSLVDDWRWHKD